MVDYDLQLCVLPGTNTRHMICFHGYGGNYLMAQSLKEDSGVDLTLVSFNFPDHDLGDRDYDPKNLSFGTFNELLPALHVLKEIIINQGKKDVDLYGYSAGGGALVNLLAWLNSSEIAPGINEEEKKRILGAIQAGIVILDRPLKSVEEIIDLRGSSLELEILAENYRKNKMSPIDNIAFLKGLNLNVIIHFQTPDEVISNRDDPLYVEKWRDVSGKINVIIGHGMGHEGHYQPLWEFYREKLAAEKEC